MPEHTVPRLRDQDWTAVPALRIANFHSRSSSQPDYFGTLRLAD